LHKTIRKINPDVIISFDAPINIYTIISRAFLKNKLIVSERNDPYKYPGNKFVRKLRDILYHFADGFVFQTHDAKKYFPTSIQQKGTIIHNPISKKLPYWNENNTEKTIITACRLVHQKNLPMLIDAFSIFLETYPEYKLKIFGEGELRDELQTLVNKKGLTKKVLMPGFSKNIHAEMANSNLFIISSNYEGVSNSMLEALAIGVPVISTDAPIGGAKMFINDGVNGILIKVGDVEGLSNAMLRLISDKCLSISLSYEARKIRNELIPEKIVKHWINYSMRIYRSNNE
jgi:glycosyltransferase involved in cell wall biosynthesis